MQSQTRTHRLQVVVNDDERAQIERAAEHDRRSISDYLRTLALNHIERRAEREQQTTAEAA